MLLEITFTRNQPTFMESNFLVYLIALPGETGASYKELASLKQFLMNITRHMLHSLTFIFCDNRNYTLSNNFYKLLY
jgi:hypothetical protein